jgi:molybdopterin molybdotransferase
MRGVSSETLPLVECMGRALAEDISAPTDLPLFDNSGMDGFAVRAADLREGAEAELRVVADIPAGSEPTITLGPGEAARIMTGAPMPRGADAVIPVEDTDFQVREAGTPAPPTVKALKSISRGQNVRRRGSDLKSGELVLRAGSLLRPQDLGLLAMLGQAEVRVHRRPRVALLSSGDEIVPVETALTPGKIHDSNSYVLAALIEQAGAELIRLGVAADQREAVEALLEKAAASEADLIISSAGVSVGAFDFVKEVVDAKGSLDFWRVNMRPGKPLAFGEYRGIPFIGLPGNPISAFVGFKVFAEPAIQCLCGLGRAVPYRALRVRLGEAIESDGRESYLRAELREVDGAQVAFLSGHQGSANMPALVRANALLIIPAGVKSAPAGREVEAWIL